MNFYEQFSEKYDSLVWSEARYDEEEKFFKQLFSQSEVEIDKVLDCACGTGHHVVIFEKRLDLQAIGSDVSEAMVKRAKKVAERKEVNTDFKVLDFRKLTKQFSKKSFDAVVCVGNSLPHLKTDEDLIKALKEMHSVIANQGMLILRLRNYDLLKKEKKRFMPVTITEEEAFFYVLDYYNDKIVFNVINLNFETGDFEVYSTEYNPLQKNALEELLIKAGICSGSVST